MVFIVSTRREPNKWYKDAILVEHLWIEEFVTYKPMFLSMLGTEIYTWYGEQFKLNYLTSDILSES